MTANLSALMNRDQTANDSAERWKYTNIESAVRRLSIEDQPVPAVMHLIDNSGFAKVANRSVQETRELLAAEKRGESPWPPARFDRGVHVDVPANQIVQKPIEISIGTVPGRFSASMLAVRLGKNAVATIIERRQGAGPFLNHGFTVILLEEGARLHHYRIQDYAADGMYLQWTDAMLAENSLYDTFTLTTGSAMSASEINTYLQGAGAHVELNGVNLLRGVQHGDTAIKVNHEAPNCTSHQFYRSVLDNQARGVFQGKIYVARDAQKTDGFQMSRALLLSEGAEMDTKPELEIYADDVKCSHGTTTGQLDEEALFYMRSRGIGMAEARGLLIGAFVNEAIDKIKDEQVRGEFAERVRSWLGN